MHMRENERSVIISNISAILSFELVTSHFMRMKQRWYHGLVQCPPPPIHSPSPYSVKTKPILKPFHLGGVHTDFTNCTKVEVSCLIDPPAPHLHLLLLGVGLFQQAVAFQAHKPEPGRTLLQG